MPQNIESELKFFSEEFIEPIYDPKVVQRVLELAQIPKGSLILDAGCGGGYWGRHFASSGCKTIGVDLSENVIAIAKEKALPGQTFQVCNLNNELPFTKQFDGIVCGGMLHHLPKKEDVVVVISNLIKCLKPKGKLIIVEPNGSNPIVRLSRILGRILVQTLSLNIATENETMHAAETYKRLINKKNLKIKILESCFHDTTDRFDKNNKLISFFVLIRRLLLKTVWKILPEPYRGTELIIIADLPN